MSDAPHLDPEQRRLMQHLGQREDWKRNPARPFVDDLSERISRLLLDVADLRAKVARLEARLGALE